MNFRPDLVPRMSALEGALKGEAVQIEVRRVSPLSMVLECSGPTRLTSLVARAVDALGGVEKPASDGSATGDQVRELSLTREAV